MADRRRYRAPMAALCPGIVLALLTLPAAYPSARASSTSVDGSANILPAISASFLQHLDFGTIVADTVNGSTVRVLRGRDNRSVCGAGLTCMEPGNRARIRITGAPGYRFTISDPGSTVLNDGSGNSMLVDSFVGGGSGNDTSYGRVVRLRSNGISTLNIGATLHVAANQPPGAYTGTYTVTVSYE